MSDKKNIDRLFQEKFKDFEVEPNEQIWLNIDAVLRKNKKRRIIPIWFKLTGIAAGLILGFFAFNFLFDDVTSSENNQVVIETEKQSNQNSTLKSPENEAVVNTENSSEKNTDNNIENPVNPTTDQKTNKINSSEKTNKDAIVNQTKSPKTKSGEVNPETSFEKNNAVANTSTQFKKSSIEKKTVRNSSDNSAKAIVNNTSKKGKDKKGSVTRNAISNTEVNAIANNSKYEKTKKDSQTNNIKDINSNSKTDEINTIAEGNNSDNINRNASNRISDQEKSNSSVAANQKSIDENIIKDNSFADETKTDVKKKDSTALALAEPNALEELLKKNEKEGEKIAEAKKNRWQITSSVAPIFFNSTSNGSPIDGQFSENSKSYENNMSFGVGLNYAVNKKISIRTGVNKFTLGYNTNDVVFFAAMDQVNFGSVASSAAGSTIQVVSMSNSEALRPVENGIQHTNEGIMTQRMGYFEVPVEISYKLIDNKFGINLIGGMSTLFLNENEVSVSSSVMSATLGKAKNLNDVHFSTNIGLGFRYRFLKSFEANFEPMFKYQINTFNKDDGNFKPYFIGLYSGVSFNF